MNSINPRYIVQLFILFCSSILFAQPVLVINELDCDTPGLDEKEFVELKSKSPNFSLDGYAIVFYNGSTSVGNAAYQAYDLDGYTTDVNGIFLIGSTTVVPYPHYVIPVNIIQNGADAVAIYKADAIDFPIGKVAYADASLVDVLIYGTADPDATGLLDIFKTFNPNIKQINEGGGNNTNSIQRNNDGSYTAKAPTPRRPNDGSGIILNGVITTFAKNIYKEGESFDIVFTTEQNVSEDLSIDFTLNNGSFKKSDYSGLTNLLIKKGDNKITTTIKIIDDTEDEGDEEMLMKMATLPNVYLALNNSVVIRVEDNDFEIANFGTPLKPTRGKVLSTQPLGYYKPMEGLSGNNLRNAMQSIIADTSIVRAQTYNDVYAMLKEADQNPENSGQVWLVYSEIGRSKIDAELTTTNFKTWNREHTWPRSRGGFGNAIGDDAFDGKNIYTKTNADSTRHANSDGHHIRAEDSGENSSRGNQFYGEYHGPAGSKGSFKGDVARSVFFLDVRYNGLELVKGYPETEVGKFGDLDTLLSWHRNDPPDDFEMNRNNVIYTWQYNRNPFIDNPELVEYIWGDEQGEKWFNSTSTSSVNKNDIKIFPNPSSGKVIIENLKTNSIIQIFSIDGKLVLNQKSQDSKMDLNLSKGSYIINVSHGREKYSEKLVVE